jgi:hypothetical protein
MTKREFIMQFVLNRAHADRQTDAPFWVNQANAAWDKLNELAPEPKFPPVDPNSSAVTGTPKFNV